MTHPDIVQRLLAWEPMISSGYECPAAGVVVAEAATEITTLRQQLADAREALALMSPNWHPGDFA